MCEEKMLNPKGTGGDIVMKMIDDANNLMVVRFFNLFDTLHLLQRVFDKNPKLQKIHQPKMKLQNYLLLQLQKSMKSLPQVFDHPMNLIR